MVSASSFSLSAIALLVSSVAAQVYTDCNPLNETCPANPALGTELYQNFNSTPKEGVWNVTNGQIEYDADQGAAFTVNKKGDAPTIETNFYFFFGRTEVVMKVAPGDGIISSIVWLSDILDEVDWEFFGSNTTHAETNWFGRGEPDFTNAIYHPMDNPVEDYHNYTTTWTSDSMDFYIDGEHVRQLLPADANDGENYPQTPMKFSLGIWAAGDPDQPEGTREWAQGTTDYDQGPFTMWVKSAAVEDYSTGKEYVYSDHSGDWQSIEIVQGNSTVKEVIEAEPEKSLAEKWAELPDGTKTGIYAGASGFVACVAAAGLFYCFRQRRRGAKEAAEVEKRAEAERLEMAGFHATGRNLDSLPAMASPGGNDYKAPDSPISNYRGGTPMEERAWDPTTSGSAPMPLLRDDALAQGGAHSPLPQSSPYSDNPPRLTTPGPQGSDLQSFFQSGPGQAR
ncbi:glycoside hydrolase family 16 protein [Zalerion maritima]|uniref:chitinase n=1 Tax=Zalerion maritima TaxID=339359 RepID=A0AAD5RSL1_9PEZI|nr:glycoside hydrolase family 16 protein [Zalerion maritima]